MKKKSIKLQKLNLRAETIHSLESAQMQAIAGGATLANSICAGCGTVNPRICPGNPAPTTINSINICNE